MIRLRTYLSTCLILAAKTVSEAQPNNQGLIKKKSLPGQNKQKSAPSGPAKSNSAAAARTEAGKISEGLTGEALLKSRMYLNIL